jgi:tight adherence protein B
VVSGIQALPASALSCVALAGALLVAPSGIGRSRLAALFPGRRRARRLRAGVAVPIVLGGAAGFGVAGPAGAVAGGVIAGVVRTRRARKRAETAGIAVSSQLAEAIGRIAEELRSGGHPAAALGGVAADGPLAGELLAPAAAAAALGDDVAGALRRSAGEHPARSGDLTRLAAAWALSEQHGVPLADLLADIQADMVWRIRFAAGVRAQLAGPRATATLLTVLPVFGIGLGQLIGADPVSVLRTGLLGQALVIVGVGLAVAGAVWSERIIAAAVPR